MHLRLPTLLLMFGIAGCSGADCINEVREELVSPDGTKKVIVFTRNCGATTGPNTQASIVEKAERLPDTPVTVFSIDKGRAKVSWKNDGGILVILDGTARIFKKESSVRGVAIEYREEKG